MRVTRHNARGVKKSSQGFSAKHNDRNYDVTHAKNIKVENMRFNRYLVCCRGKENWYSEQSKGEHPTFDEVEHDYYEKHFRKQYEATQERYKAKRNYAKLTDFDTWRKQKIHCPEETCVQIGNVDGHVTRKEMLTIGNEYLIAERKYFREHNIKCTVLDAAFHGDEAVGHLQIRRVYHYTDADGIEKIGQNECLKRSDLQLPNPFKPCVADNNYKMTMDADLRAILLDICEAHGLTIEREPERNVKHNRSKEKLIADKERQKVMEETIDYQTKLLAEQRENEILREAERIKQSRLNRMANADADVGAPVEQANNNGRGYELGF
mgnify:CR=1 FL=1